MNKLALTAFLLLALLAGCTQAVRENGPNGDSQAQGGDFSLTFPRGWREEKYEDGSIVAHDKIKDNYRENILVAFRKAQDKETAESVHEKARTELSELPGYRELETGSVTIAGTEAKRANYTFKGLRGLLKAQAYYFVIGGRAYFIICTAESSQFDNYKNTFETIAKSFMVEQE